MKLVINVPDYIKEQADNGKGEEFGIPLWLAYEIANGTPLPKGHGRLIDADIILNKALTHRESYMEAENSSYCRGKLHAYEFYVEEVENAPTIIEADEAESEE